MYSHLPCIVIKNKVPFVFHLFLEELHFIDILLQETLNSKSLVAHSWWDVCWTEVNLRCAGCLLLLVCCGFEFCLCCIDTFTFEIKMWFQTGHHSWSWWYFRCICIFFLGLSRGTFLLLLIRLLLLLFDEVFLHLWFSCWLLAFGHMLWQGFGWGCHWRTRSTLSWLPSLICLILIIHHGHRRGTRRLPLLILIRVIAKYIDSLLLIPIPSSHLFLNLPVALLGTCLSLFLHLFTFCSVIHAIFKGTFPLRQLQWILKLGFYHLWGCTFFASHVLCRWSLVHVDLLSDFQLW